MTGWEISPFEPDGLRVTPLRPPVLPGPARHGEDPLDCGSCRRRDEGLWFNDRWRLTRIAGAGVPLVLMLYPRDHYDMAHLPDELAAELGVLAAHIVRHVEALPHVSRAHVYRVGDGGRGQPAVELGHVGADRDLAVPKARADRAAARPAARALGIMAGPALLAEMSDSRQPRGANSP